MKELILEIEKLKERIQSLEDDMQEMESLVGNDVFDRIESLEKRRA